MKYIKPLMLLGVVTLFLTGCDKRTDLEKQLQAVYDVNRNQGACFFVPESENLPYITKQIAREDYGNFFGNEILNKRFDLYTKVGLFQKEKISEDDDKDTYRYSLTELGKQYITPKGFCAGNVYIEGIEDMTEPVTTATGTKVRTVYFRYQITDYPKWFTENEKRLNAGMSTTLLNGGLAYKYLIDDGEKQFFDEEQPYMSFGYFVYKFNR